MLPYRRTTQVTLVVSLIAVIALAACIAPTPSSSGSYNKNAVDTCFEKLPPHWAVVESFLAPSEQTAAIQTKLGARIATLSNTVLSVHGQRIQVNIIDCPTENDATKIYDVISGMKEHPAFCIRRGTRVVEFVGDSIQLAIKATYELGFTPKPTGIRFRVTAELVPIDECDYMSFNELFNLFLRVRNSPGDEQAKSRIRELSKLFRFGEHIELRMSTVQDARPTYHFEPAPASAHTAAHGETVTYIFGDTHDSLGVPYVSFVAEIQTRDDGMTATTREEDPKLIAATDFWPVDDPDIVALAGEITKGHQSTEARAEAILKWLSPGKNIQFGGPVTGSRWGVKKVLQQGYGHCWDFSDCFVTLCRASGVPSRQVGGWLYGSSGHIWAEILLPDQGWRQVDPTGGAAMNCGIYYIPYFTSEDGNMPILYTSMPEVEILSEGGSG